MSVKLAGRLAGTLLLAMGLAGCIDAKVDVHLTSMTTAKAVMTQVMAPDFYAMVKTNEAQTETDAPADDDQFCAEGTLTENRDGGATCVIIEEGVFADLSMGNEKQTIAFTPVGPGLVRVALPTADMKGEIGIDDKMDAETKAMVEAFFKDHAITLHFSGAEVTDTNMVLADDKTSAEMVIPFLDLINGTAELPDEIYAVVRVQ
jgi:hypothetical protein